MVKRVFVEKKKELAHESAKLLADVKTLLNVNSVEEIRIVNRYDAENITDELFEYATKTVFSEPQLDIVSDSLDLNGVTAFAVEYLPGQFDQRADSAEQCIQIISQGERPTVRTARVYIIKGNVSKEELAQIKKYVINPVESREADMSLPKTLKVDYEIPTTVKTVEGFIDFSDKELEVFLNQYGLAMDIDDVKFCRAYFQKEGRNPTITEIRMLDTYWSDHCRHTTFLTNIDSVEFEDPLVEKTYQEYLETRKNLGRTKPVCLMDVATLAVKHLRKQAY